MEKRVELIMTVRLCIHTDIFDEKTSKSFLGWWQKDKNKLMMQLRLWYAIGRKCLIGDFSKKKSYFAPNFSHQDPWFEYLYKYMLSDDFLTRKGGKLG